MKKGFQRQDRVADLIQKTLAEIMLREMNDVQFRLLTITDVSISKDLSYAKIFVSTLEEDPEKIKKIIMDLNLEAKSLRFLLAQAVKLRITPELKFYYDESAARGYRISNLINQAMNDKTK